MKSKKDIKTRILGLEAQNKAIRSGMKIFTDNLDAINNINTIIDQNAARIVELEWVLNL